MALTLITHPCGDDTARLFGGFSPVEFVFKREDMQIVSTEAGTGGVKINIGTDLTTYLNAGDSIFLYSEGVGYTYNNSGTILEIDATSITIDMPFVLTTDTGYINYFKNYYVELQCIHKDYDTINILPFALQTDGNIQGEIVFDVSIVNDINRQRTDSETGLLANSRTEFCVKYKQVYEGSTEDYTVLDEKLLVLLYTTETPRLNELINKFSNPKIYLGYDAYFIMSRIGGIEGGSVELRYNELDINNVRIGTDLLSSIDSGLNGLVSFKWDYYRGVDFRTKFIELFIAELAVSDFKTVDFASPDFVTN